MSVDELIDEMIADAKRDTRIGLFIAALCLVVLVVLFVVCPK